MYYISWFVAMKKKLLLMCDSCFLLLLFMQLEWARRLANTLELLLLVVYILVLIENMASKQLK